LNQLQLWQLRQFAAQQIPNSTLHSVGKSQAHEVERSMMNIFHAGFAYFDGNARYQANRWQNSARGFLAQLVEQRTLNP
jgi:hypothetical protein